MTLQLRYVSHSEIGLVRKNNQDSGFASPTLLVVADGMGGAAAGDLASAVAVDTIKRIDRPAAGEAMLQVLAGALDEANDRIADLVDADRTLDGMGTTVTGALFDGVALGLAHIGDSRAYLWRSGELQRLTHDHSWVQSLVDEGKISAEEAAVHPHRSLLLKVLNGHAANHPDLSLVPLQPGDRLMLCSDGVCGLVDDPEIAAALAEPQLEAARDRLVDEARAEGGIDNITVIVADVVDAGGTTEPALVGAAAERVIPPAGTAAGAVGSLGDDPDDDPDGDSDGPAHPVATRRTPAPAGGPVEDEARYNPQAPHNRRLLRPLVGLLVLVLVVGAGVGTAYAWARTQYYVGAEGEQVAIFQGLSEGLPGIRVSKVYEVQPLAVGTLPAYYQAMVRASIDVSGLDSARETVAELTEAAKRCVAQAPSARPSQPAGPSVAPTPSPTPTVTAPTVTASTGAASTGPASTAPTSTAEPSC